MPKKHKFPEPSDYQKKDPLVFCPNDRVVKLYNEATGQKRKSIAKKVIEWFKEEAPKHGWIDSFELPVVQKPTKSAGFVLFNPTLVKVEHHLITIKSSPED
jgi:hypothetical protein